MLLADGSKEVTISESQYTDLKAVLRKVYQKSRAKIITLCDLSGLVLADAGKMDTTTMAALSALAAANHAATNEIAKLIGEPRGFDQQFLEGKEANLFMVGAKPDLVLCVVFAKETTFGMLRLLVQKAIPEIEAILKREISPDEKLKTISTVNENIATEDFQDELSSKLDAALMFKG